MAEQEPGAEPQQGRQNPGEHRGRRRRESREQADDARLRRNAERKARREEQEGDRSAAKVEDQRKEDEIREKIRKKDLEKAKKRTTTKAEKEAGTAGTVAEKSLKVGGKAIGGATAAGLIVGGGILSFVARFGDQMLSGLRKFIKSPKQFFSDLKKHYSEKMQRPPKGVGFFKGFFNATKESLFGEPPNQYEAKGAPKKASKVEGE